MKPLDELPDACFVEDTVVVHGSKALMTRPTPESRRGELETVEEILKDYLQISHVRDPGNLEGGDVIHFQDRLISGITQRSNLNGVQQMRNALGVRVDSVEDSSIIHLKSYVTYLGESTLVTTRRYANHPLLSNYSKILIPEHEAYAANTLTINGVVLVPAGHFDSIKLLKVEGFDVIPHEVSEFEKCEGALTCLSIIF